MRSLIALLALLFPVLVAATEFPGDSKLTRLAWYPEKIELFRAWEIVDQTPDVLIAVLDLDFDLDHPDLVDVVDMSVALDLSGNNFKVHQYPESRHGTLVTNILAGNGFNKFGTSGISRRARVMPINWSGESGSIAAGITAAVKAGAKVVNCSCSIHSPDAKTISALRKAIEFAGVNGTVLVFSAGNFGYDGDRIPVFPAAFTAEYDNVISVGASTEDDQKGYSVFGKKTVDLFAPGHQIIAAYNKSEYRFSDGTSEAAPIVSGVIALMLQENPQLTPRWIKKILMLTVDKPEALRGLAKSDGRLNAYRAIKAARDLKTNN